MEESLRELIKRNLINRGKNAQSFSRLISVTTSGTEDEFERFTREFVEGSGNDSEASGPEEEA